MLEYYVRNEKKQYQMETHEDEVVLNAKKCNMFKSLPWRHIFEKWSNIVDLNIFLFNLLWYSHFLILNQIGGKLMWIYLGTELRKYCYLWIPNVAVRCLFMIQKYFKEKMLVWIFHGCKKAWIWIRSRSHSFHFVIWLRIASHWNYLHVQLLLKLLS